MPRNPPKKNKVDPGLLKRAQKGLPNRSKEHPGFRFNPDVKLDPTQVADLRWKKPHYMAYHNALSWFPFRKETERTRLMAWWFKNMGPNMPPHHYLNQYEEMFYWDKLDREWMKRQRAQERKRKR